MVAFGSLVAPLEAPFQALLDGLARSARWSTSEDIEALGQEVRSLSGLYNRIQTPPVARPSGGRSTAESAHSALAARLLFSFPRDVPKGAAAVRELVGAGLLAIPGSRPLRILDVGAGLGAMTWGAVRALEAAGQRGEVEALFADADPGALSLALEIVRRAPPGGVSLRADRARLVAGDKPPRGPFDLVLVGQLLSELDEELPPGERVVRHLALLESLLAVVSNQGSLVVVEPALRDRARHLHRLRDGWIAAGRPVFAPCLHQAPCPALASEDDWCHEDLAVNLPPWLVPVARAAGLRWEGLTFSYLVLRKDGSTLADLLPGARLRVVSSLLRTKGKSEAFLCGRFEEGVARARLRRLDRDASQENQAWDELGRGALLSIEPAPQAGGRVGGDSLVRPVPAPAGAGKKAQVRAPTEAPTRAGGKA